MNHKLVTMSRHSTSKCFSKSQDTLGSLGFMYFPHLGIFRPLQDIYTVHIYIYIYTLCKTGPFQFQTAVFGVGLSNCKASNSTQGKEVCRDSAEFWDDNLGEFGRFSPKSQGKTVHDGEKHCNDDMQ